RQQNLKQAAADFDQVIQLKSETFDAYLNRAVAHQGLGNYQGAIDDLTKALDLGAPYTRVYFMRARAREKAGDADGARRDWEEGRGGGPAATGRRGCGRSRRTRRAGWPAVWPGWPRTRRAPSPTSRRRWTSTLAPWRRCRTSPTCSPGRTRPKRRSRSWTRRSICTRTTPLPGPVGGCFSPVPGRARPRPRTPRMSCGATASRRRRTRRPASTPPP